MEKVSYIKCKPTEQSNRNFKKLSLLILCFIILFSSRSFAATINYYYDKTNRLIYEENDTAAIEYVYDEVGNMIRKTVFSATADPTSIDFGNVAVGSTAAGRPITVSNLSNATLAISAITLTGTDSTQFGITSDNCTGTSVGPHGTCTFTPSFSPTTAGLKSAEAIITFSNSTTPSISVSLTGGTDAVEMLFVTPSSYDFGGVVGGATTDTGFSIVNNGGQTLSIGTLSLSGPNASEFQINSNGCDGRMIAPSGVCNFVISFAPTTAGDKTATVSIPSDDPLISVLEVPLTGSALIYNLTVTKSGTSGGSVTSSPAGAECGSVCNATYNGSTTVTLMAAGDSCSAFIGWSGCDVVDGNQCILTMNADRSVTANFIASYAIDLTPSSESFTHLGGSGTLQVVAPQNGCTWPVESNAPWITITSGGNGAGNGTVSYSVAGTTSIISQAGTILIGGNPFTVNQSPVTGPGSLDTSFNSPQGYVTFNSLPNTNNYNGQTAVLQPDGKIVVAGQADFSLIALRYTQEGTLDTMFGINGALAYSDNGWALANAVAVQPDGKILFTGQGSTGLVLLVRYNADGTPDNSFGSNGVVTYSDNTYDSGNAMGIQADGKIVVTGYSSNGGVLLLRYTSDGTLDSTFGVNGVVTYSDGTGTLGNTLAIQPDGKIIVAGYSGYSDNSALILRFNADGGLDTSFGTNGVKTFNDSSDGDWAHAMALQADGKIVVTGQDSSCGILLLRLNSDGTTDSSFGQNGVLVSDKACSAYGLAIQPDGKILLSGGTTSSLLVLRFNGDGTADNTFGLNGAITHLDLGFSSEWASALAIQPDGKIVVAGAAYTDTGRIFVLRINGDSSGQYSLTINKTGNGSGTVISSETPSPLVNCGMICSSLYNSGSSVTLAATADIGSNFTGWSGGRCSGTGACTVTMNQAQTVTATFTINNSPAPSYTMWGDIVPEYQVGGNGSEVEVGVKFRASVDGAATGLRFYKSGGDTGTHVADLWDKSGNLLATATFTGETSSGWQQVNFTTPVAITANTTYIASYHTVTFVYTVGYFTTAVTNGALRYLANGEDGGNSVYSFGPNFFPVSTYNAANYWVDVMFTTGTVQTDTTAPTSQITLPADGSTHVSGIPLTVSGTASDTGGGVIKVEVSTDGGTTWQPATGTTNWSYSWAPSQTGSFAIKSRATDNSGNVESPSAGITVTIASPAPSYSMWGDMVPQFQVGGNGTEVEVGMKFRASVDGAVTGLRFYKAASDIGTHIAHLWDTAGNLLATATFTGETSSGWQQVNFTTPVAITANTTYIASYHTVTFVYTMGYFAKAVSNGSLHYLADGEDGGNSVYSFGPNFFPVNTYYAANYWVDVMFTSGTAQADTTAPISQITAPTDGSTYVSGIPLTVSGTASDTGGGVVKVEVSTDGGTTWQPAAGTTRWSYSWTPSQTGSYNIKSRATDNSGNVESPLVGVTITIAAPAPSYGMWGDIVPEFQVGSNGSEVEVGVKFRVSVDGAVTGLRFYKASSDTGTHVAHVWDIGGNLLATATFANETSNGWQQVNFTAPVAVTANTTYIASYHAVTFVYTIGYFANAVTNGALRYLADGEDGGNSVYSFGPNFFPVNTYNAANYWVDVMFTSGTAQTDSAPPASQITAPADGSTHVSGIPMIVSGTASDTCGGGVVKVEVSTDGGTTWQPAAGTTNWSYSWTPTQTGSYNIKSRATDNSGNVESPSTGVAITIASPAPSYSMWGDIVPQYQVGSNGTEVEVGVKFRASVDGAVTGLRFYKASSDTGTHVAHLWDAGGNLLATATFANETSSGWQQVNFAAPVAVAANTTYIASYHTVTFVYTVGYFASAVTNGSLRYLANGEDGGNSVYSFGPNFFPVNTYNAANYWVDVMFTVGTL